MIKNNNVKINVIITKTHKKHLKSQVSAETNNTSRAVSIVNDETMRGWHLSATDLEQDDDDESIILDICEYFDGQLGRICGTAVEAGTNRCPEHRKPEFNQPMEMIKHFKELDPGRAFHLVKDLQVEIPKSTDNDQIHYANNVDGDTKVSNKFYKMLVFH